MVKAIIEKLPIIIVIFGLIIFYKIKRTGPQMFRCEYNKQQTTLV